MFYETWTCPLPQVFCFHKRVFQEYSYAAYSFTAHLPDMNFFDLLQAVSTTLPFQTHMEYKEAGYPNNIRLPHNISWKAANYLEEEWTPLDEVWELEVWELEASKLEVEPGSEPEVMELELLDRSPEEVELPKSELLPSGITSSEMTPSGWEEAELLVAEEEMSELAEELWELSEVLEELKEPEELEVPILSELEAVEVPDETDDEIDELLGRVFLPHPTKATAKIAANANKVFFIFKLPRFEEVFI